MSVQTNDATGGEPPLVEIRGLSIRFSVDPARPATVDAIDLVIARGETVALVGESGSGKTLLAHAIAGILDPAARIEAQRFAFAGRSLLAGPAAWDGLRGREIGIVFQNARAALHPLLPIGRQIADVLAAHTTMPRHERDAAVIEALKGVRIPDPARRAGAYPGELSGGMCQRVMLALALAGAPALLIADEPTTGLDTTTQAAILALMRDHARARRMATLLITHDLALARAHAGRVIVMHAGQIVEDAPVADFFARPRHPYAGLLIATTPAHAACVGDLAAIRGSIPDLTGQPAACRFAERCDRSDVRCQRERPPWTPGAHGFACWKPA
jgi:peptide/nickel transport system ATP-binding protein